MSDTLGAVIEFISKIEKLIIISISLALACIAAFFLEKLGFVSFNDLPLWAKPTAWLVFLVCSAHIVTRFIIEIGRGARYAQSWVAERPARLSRQKFDQEIIDRLESTSGLAREALCYALYHDDNHIWDSKKRKWIRKLVKLGLLNKYDVEFATIHYRINWVAWSYMKKNPYNFRTKISWPDSPWTCDLDEDEIEKLYQEKFTETSKIGDTAV